MQSSLEGRNWVGKCAQVRGMTASLRKLSSKADSNTWESFTRSELKLESVHQESPRSDIFRKRATKPLGFTKKQKHRPKNLTWAKEKNNWSVAQWSKVLFSDKSKFCISFVNQGPRGRVERNIIHVAWIPFCIFHSYDLGCYVICWCWSTMLSEVHSQRSHLPGHFRALQASFCWRASWRWLHFPAGLCICRHCLRYQKLVQWPWCYCAWLASKLASPEPHSTVKRKTRETPDPTMQMTWRPLSKQPGRPLHRSSATGWFHPCYAALMQ